MEKKLYFCSIMRRRTFILTLFLCLNSALMADDPVITSDYSYKRFTIHDGLSQMQTEKVWQDSQGYIYIGTLSGFVRYDGRALQPYLKGKRINIVGFGEQDGIVSAYGFRRKWQLSGGELKESPLTDWGGQFNNFNSASLPDGMFLLEDREESNRKLCRITDNGFETVLQDPVLDKMYPDRKVFVDSTSVYVPTEEGLFVKRNDRVYKLTSKINVFTLMRQSSVLYAFAADGIYSVEKDSLIQVASFEFSDPDYGLDVCQDLAGKIYIADSHSLYLFDGTSVLLLSSGFNMIKDVFIDRWNRLWMATYQGVYLFYNTEFETYRLTDKNDIVRSMCIDKSGKMVLGTLNGRIIYDGRVVSDIDGNFYSSNAAMINGKVYIPGNGDIMCVDGEEAEWLGLSHDKYQFVSPHGNMLLIGTRNALLTYNPTDRTVDTLTTDIPRPWCSYSDNKGHVMVGSPYGLYKLESKREKGKINYEVSVMTWHSNRLTVTTMSPSPNGGLFVASSDSIFLVKGDSVELYSEKIPEIQNHEIRSLHFSPKGYLVVAAIDGLLVSEIDGEYNVIRTRWFDYTNGFTSLEPLNAQMCEDSDGRVWLAGIEDVTSFAPSVLLDYDEWETVIVPPVPWWRQWWAFAAYAVMLTLIVWYFIHNYEKRRMRRALFTLQREMKQKELLIQAIHLKSFPHFHANVMAGIEYMMINNPKEAGKYMKIYSDFTNQTLENIDCTCRTISEEMDYALLYLQLEKLRYGNRLTYDTYVADDVNMQTLVPNMLIYTYVQNAVKHGIGNKSEGGCVNVSITRRDNSVVVSVSDNGVGREAAAKLNLHSTKMGLRILLGQIELFNQSNQNNIVQTVTDLKDAEGNPSGTKFEMVIPIDYKYSISSSKH